MYIVSRRQNNSTPVGINIRVSLSGMPLFSFVSPLRNVASPLNVSLSPRGEIDIA